MTRASTHIRRNTSITWQGVHHCQDCTKSVKVKVKCTLVQALRLWTGRTANWGSRGIALLFLDHGTRRGEGSASRPGRSLPPEKTRYPLYRRLGGPQGRSGQVRKISPPPGFDPRTVQPVASRYTDWANRPMYKECTSDIKFCRDSQCGNPLYMLQMCDLRYVWSRVFIT